MSLKVEDIIFLYSGIFIFTGLISYLGVSLYFAYTKMESMLEHLKQCPFVMDRTSLINGGPWGRLILLGTISGLMLTPNLFLRNGGANIENLNSFPSGLKRKLVLLQWTGRLFFLLMIILLVLRKTGTL